MKCKHCGGSSLTKKVIRNHKQRLYCKTCCKYSQSRYTYKAYEQSTDQMIIRLLKEGCGVRGISRILEISPKTVLSRMLRLSDTVKPPDLDDVGGSFEMDELWTFVGNKNQVVWLTYVIERKSGLVIDFFVSRKSKETIAPIIDKILSLYPQNIYTDKLNIYPSLIPREIHRSRKYCTNKIERMNLTLRTHVKRLSRKTICFSRKRKYLVAHLKIYFWSNNNFIPMLDFNESITKIHSGIANRYFEIELEGDYLEWIKVLDLCLVKNPSLDLIHYGFKYRTKIYRTQERLTLEIVFKKPIVSQLN